MLMLSALLASPALAHGDHGLLDGSQILHYLFEHGHWLLFVLVLLLVYRQWRKQV